MNPQLRTAATVAAYAVALLALTGTAYLALGIAASVGAL